MPNTNTFQPELILDLPYISAALPGIGGQLRSSPDHFIVEELPLYEPIGEGQHLYVNLTKETLTTRDVQRQLALLFKVANAEVGFAGMKDKYARTTQTFSINVGHIDDQFVADAFERIQTNLPVQVHWTKLHRNKLKAGHLLGNRFTIVISDLRIPAGEALAQAQAVVDCIKARGLPNYYGPQRLGQQGSNVSRGLGVITGNLDVRDRWLRDLLKASVQSYLCNRYLARRVEDGLFDQLLVGDVAKKYDTGGLFAVEDLDAEQPRYERKEISFTAPIYGPKMWITDGPAGEYEAAILADHGLTLEQMGKARLTGTRRLGRLLFPDLEIRTGERGLELSFSLSKGAFATTVLREVMKIDDNALATLPVDDSD
ncbi:MAG: tRNA pseudouridine(13) synthase TruD [Caldilineaceae bacterium]|nr:tRNA pseudouridine(13) synthase TruD [Caldilineaceae bacterium]